MAATERKSSISSIGKEYGHSAPYGALLLPGPEHKFDTGWSWVVNAGVFLVSFLIVGWFRCYGVIFLSIQEIHYDSNFDTSWVGTANAVCFNLFAPLGSLLAERFTNRCVVITGGVMMAVGLVAGYFSYSLAAYIVSIGVMHGIGAALAFVPSVVMLGTYFRKRMGLATGIAFAGSSFSQLVMPPLVTTLVDHYGLHGSLLILGALALNVCVAGVLFFPVGPASLKAADDEILRQLAMEDLKLKRKENPIVKKESAASRPPHPTITEEGDEHVFSDVPLMGETAIKETGNEKGEEQPAIEGKYKKQRRSSTSSIGAGRRASRSFSVQLPGRLRRFSVRRMSMTLTTVRRDERLRSAMANLKSPVLWMLMVGYSVGAFVFAAGMKYFPPFAKEQSLDKSQMALMLALCGIPDIVTRIGVGLALDTNFIKKKVKRYRIFALAIFILSVASFIIPFTRTFNSCLFAFLLFGLGVGCFFTTSSVACFDLIGRERYRVAYGWMLFLASLTHLIDSVGVAKLRDVTGDYTASFLLMGCAGLVASICVAMEVVFLRQRKTRHPDW